MATTTGRATLLTISQQRQHRAGGRGPRAARLGLCCGLLVLSLLAWALPAAAQSPCSSAETDVTFSYFGNYQSWVVPAGISTARIYATGADGGGSGGGSGASMRGTFSLTPGETLQVLVGAAGAVVLSSGGGGGGSFVTRGGGGIGHFVPGRLILIAGGGGGMGVSSNGAGGNAGGGIGSGGNAQFACGGGGINGNGGSISGRCGGGRRIPLGAGGGWGIGGAGGFGGGGGGRAHSSGSSGGGGGGARGGWGGGSYSGGVGGQSYNAGTSQSNSSGSAGAGLASNGSVTICRPSVADLSITKTDSPDPVAALDTLTYSVTVSNAGPDGATGVVVTDTLPAGVSSAVTSGCAEDPNGVPACTLGTIAASGMASYTIAVTVGTGAAGEITNTATVSSDAIDLESANDTATATTTVDCPDPATPGLYGGFTAASCASSVVKAKNQAQLDAYLADFGVGGGSKPKHVNVMFNPATTNFTVISPCRIKVLGASKLVDVAADNVCLFGRAGVTVGAGTPAAGSLIDVDTGDLLLVSEEGKVQTKPGIAYIAGDMELDAETDADVGSGSTIDVMGPLAVGSVSGAAAIQSGADVTVDSLTVSADQEARIGDGSTVDVSGNLSMTSTSSAAEIQQSSIVVVGGNLDLSGFSCKIAGLADVDVTGTATLAASGSATASDAEILSGATLTAADVSQTAEHKAVLSGGATVDAGAGNAEVDAPVCVVDGTVTAGSVSGSCLP